MKQITKLKLFTVSLSLSALFAVSCLAQDRVAAGVDAYIKAEMEKQHIPGLSLAVIKDGKIIKAAGYGLANVEQNIPVKPETVFKIGSVSKQLIAAGILLLVQEGKVSLDDKVGKYLDGTPETWNPITVRHLLTHTSGIVREAPGFDPQKVQSDADVIKTAYPLPLRFAPGEKYEYCNVGYFSLAEIIRKVSGKPWPEYLNDRLFARLGMKATRPTSAGEDKPVFAKGYSWEKDKFTKSPDWIALRPSGAFLSTVLDLAKWDAALYGDKVFKPATREQMWTPVKLNSGETYPYGFGWMLEPVAGRRRVRHGGSLPGFRAALSRLIDDKLTVVVLANSDSANSDRIATGVANLYIPGLIPQRVVARVDPKIFDAYVGQYQPSTGPPATIAREGDKLTLQLGNEKRDLSPESESRFFMKENTGPTYTFVKNEKGEVTDLIILNEGREVGRAKKIK